MRMDLSVDETPAKSSDDDDDDDNNDDESVGDDIFLILVIHGTSLSMTTESVLSVSDARNDRTSRPDEMSNSWIHRSVADTITLSAWSEDIAIDTGALFSVTVRTGTYATVVSVDPGPVSAAAAAAAVVLETRPRMTSVRSPEHDSR